MHVWDKACAGETCQPTPARHFSHASFRPVVGRPSPRTIPTTSTRSHGTSGPPFVPARKIVQSSANQLRASAPDTFPGDLVCRQELRRYRQSRRRTYDTSIPPWCSRKRFRNPSSNGFGSQSNSGYCDKTLRTLRMRHRNLSLRLLAMSVADWISLSPRSNDGSSLLVAFTSTRHPMPS